MEEDMVMRLGYETIKTATLLASPLLIGALVIGLIVSILQAITQINEATLTFIPKIAIVAILLLIAGPWMIDTMITFTTELYGNIDTLVRN